MADVLCYFHPEVKAGGFPYNDQRVAFYTRVHSLLAPTHRVLEFGAGRGKYAEREKGTFRGRLATIKGCCEELVGFDVDPRVFDNPQIDSAYQAALGERLPFADASFDMIVSWAVFEHVADPGFYAAELDRVLRPGGWICAWTPNKWGYVGIGARLVPNAAHVRLLRFFSPTREEQDTFPTAYMLNTRSDLARHFKGYDHATYLFTGPPAYHADRLWLAWLIRLYSKLVPTPLAQTLHIFMRKPAIDARSGKCSSLKPTMGQDLEARPK